MKPYVYQGIEASTYFWATLVMTVILFAFIIIEEKKTKGWKKLSILTVGLPSVLAIALFCLFIHADGVAKDGLKAANNEVVQTLTKAGLEVVESNTIKVLPATASAAKVSYPDAKDDTVCRIFAPEDVSKNIEILCGSTTNGMTPENLVKWFKAGEPEDASKFEVTKEESQRIVSLIGQVTE